MGGAGGKLQVSGAKELWRLRKEQMMRVSGWFRW